ncbi:TRAP transporter small permease [Pseudoxanthomonas sp.]|uniref:TRAP transporter small permease n=1 Tax=Pseudoxanthomonas sp. TaxID=1871049 RepID=UPI00262D1B54|nr:TRAP transporter small permease [Pseudoxanthomonas sp.]WDS35214.1 MAG: TRAP transporter small permease [Pseudoxanthomonas sp.]
MSETQVASFPLPVAGVGRALDRLASGVIGIAAAALLGLVVVQGWQVFARYVLNDSPSWTEPVTLLLLSTAMSMGAAAGVHDNRHFGFFLLAQRAHGGLRTVLEAIRPLVIVGVGAVLAWWSGVLLLDGLTIKAAGAPLPQSINYAPLCLGGALMVVFGLYRLVLALRPAAVEGEG